MRINTPTFPPSQTIKWIPLVLSEVKYIILHHPEALFASYESINQWHLQNGWQGGIGYNEYIRKDGTVFIGRGDNIGAQCAGMNSVSYGICCEGNYDVETEMPEVQKLALIERIQANRRRFPNYLCTVPHSKFASTSCPGKNFPTAEILKRSEVINLNLEDALAFFVIKGVMKEADRWRTACKIVYFLEPLFINIATAWKTEINAQK